MAMLRDTVVFASLFLLLTSVFLFVFGARMRARHWAWSQITIGVMAAATWLLQNALGAGDLPLGTTLIAVFVIGSVVTACCEDWTSAAHANFTSVFLIVTTFLTYAAVALIQARLGPVSLILGWLLLLLQLAVLILLVAHTFEILDVVCRTRWRRSFGPRIVAGYAPNVSIHVPTHNEPPELVIETLNALARLDYPNYEVLVIDNNTNDEDLWRPVEAHCATLGTRFRFFHLSPWPGYKSGALNFALDQVAPDTEIVGIVDADYIVEPNYLHDLVGHFADPNVAFVQTPQDYRDAEDRGRYGRALYLSYRYFFDVSMHSRNERNGVIFAGTMGLIRRDMLTEVGRWDEWCITEDAEVSLRLLNAGYDSVFVDHPYGRGLMPPDFAALKRQRFRWAFGGMQLLRMHARTLCLTGAGRLTMSQRLAYLSGGLQWLNDPVTAGFTMIMIVAAAALAWGESLYLQPLVAGTIMVPPLLVLFGVMRFLWAFRVRSRCTWREALDGFVILLGLTWTVTLACVRGLTARHGIFLRTPKLSARPRLVDCFRIVWFETLLVLTCVAAAAAILARDQVPLLSARTLFLGMLVWQSLIYLSAARSSLWNYQSYAGSAGNGFSFQPATNDAQRVRIPEWRLAVRLGGLTATFAGLFLIAVLFAPPSERLFRHDPLDQFIPAATLLPQSPEFPVAAQLVREADAARRQDVNAALALWDPAGVIRDEQFTPEVTDDDRWWRGLEGIRARYEEEFGLRRYQRLRHQNVVVTFRGADHAILVNDLDAVIESGDHAAAHVRLQRSDRWTFRRVSGEWRIVMLEVNRASHADVEDQKQLVATREVP